MNSANIKPGVLPEEAKGFVYKFGKSLHPIRTIEAGETIDWNNVALKAPADGIKPSEAEDAIGKVAITTVSTSEPLTWEKLKGGR